LTILPFFDISIAVDVRGYSGLRGSTAQLHQKHTSPICTIGVVQHTTLNRAKKVCFWWGWK